MIIYTNFITPGRRVDVVENIFSVTAAFCERCDGKWIHYFSTIALKDYDGNKELMKEVNDFIYKSGEYSDEQTDWKTKKWIL